MSEPARHDVRFSPEALQDLQEIAVYLTQVRGADAAQALVAAIGRRVAALDLFPHRGAPLKELLGAQNCPFRQLVHDQYRIVYGVFDDEVLILMVVDGRRDVETLFRDRLDTSSTP